MRSGQKTTTTKRRMNDKILTTANMLCGRCDSSLDECNCDIPNRPLFSVKLKKWVENAEKHFQHHQNRRKIDGERCL